jgi:hypothetical protein
MRVGRLSLLRRSGAIVGWPTLPLNFYFFCRDAKASIILFGLSVWEGEYHANVEEAIPLKLSKVVLVYLSRRRD